MSDDPFIKALSYGNISIEFIELAKTVKDKCGVYCFTTLDGKYEYIGVSSVIGKRVLISYNERISELNHPVNCSFYYTKTLSDAYVLEIYLINLLKPIQNRSRKSAQELTLKINKIPKERDKIRCNKLSIIHIKKLEDAIKSINEYIEDIKTANSIKQTQEQENENH